MVIGYWCSVVKIETTVMIIIATTIIILVIPVIILLITTEMSLCSNDIWVDFLG